MLTLREPGLGVANHHVAPHLFLSCCETVLPPASVSDEVGRARLHLLDVIMQSGFRDACQTSDRPNFGLVSAVCRHLKCLRTAPDDQHSVQE